MIKLLTEKKVLKYEKYVEAIAYDFNKVINQILSKDLIRGRNVSGYDYYIVRLASRRDIEVDMNKLKDLKTYKIKRT